MEKTYLVAIVAFLNITSCLNLIKQSQFLSKTGLILNHLSDAYFRLQILRIFTSQTSQQLNC